MVQLQRLDAHLDTLFTKLYQVNIRVGCTARRQSRLGGFVESPFPSLEAFETSEDDDDFDDNDDDDDGGASSSGIDEMST